MAKGVGGEQLNKNKSVYLVCLFFGLLVFGFAVVIVACLLLLLASFVRLFVCWGAGGLRGFEHCK